MKQWISANPGTAGALIDEERYHLVREAILNALPGGRDGVTWVEMSEMIAPSLPERLFRHRGTVRWYARAVQMDLEARGVIERIPGARPIRMRRVA